MERRKVRICLCAVLLGLMMAAVPALTAGGGAYSADAATSDLGAFTHAENAGVVYDETAQSYTFKTGGFVRAATGAVLGNSDSVTVEFTLERSDKAAGWIAIAFTGETEFVEGQAYHAAAHTFPGSNMIFYTGEGGGATNFKDSSAMYNGSLQTDVVFPKSATYDYRARLTGTGKYTLERKAPADAEYTKIDETTVETYPSKVCLAVNTDGAADTYLFKLTNVRFTADVSPDSRYGAVRMVSGPDTSVTAGENGAFTMTKGGYIRTRDLEMGAGEQLTLEFTLDRKSWTGSNPWFGVMSTWDGEDYGNPSERRFWFNGGANDKYHANYNPQNTLDAMIPTGSHDYRFSLTGGSDAEGMLLTIERKNADGYCEIIERGGEMSFPGSFGIVADGEGELAFSNFKATFSRRGLTTSLKDYAGTADAKKKYAYDRNYILDNIAKDNFTFTAAPEAGSTLVVKCNGAVITGATVEGVDNTYTPTLKEGVNTIETTVTNAGGTKDVRVFTVLYDTIKPEITTSAKNEKVYDTVYEITASMNEDGKLLVKCGETELTASAGGVYGMTLQEGENTITMQATDLSGNKSDLLTYTVTCDSKVPNIETSLKNSWTNKAAFVFTASATGATETSTATLEAKLGEDPIALTDGKYSVTLAAGVNTITLTATDSEDTHRIVVATYTVTLDTQKPALTTTAANALTKEGAYEFTASATDDLDDNVNITVTNNGAAVPLSNNKYTVPLTEGANEIVVTATDKAGNTESKTATVTRDATGPVITTSAAPESVKDAVYTFTATAADARQQGAIAVTVTFGGETITPVNGTFSVTLEPGDNEITFTAADDLGNSTTKRISVTLDTAEPVITTTAVDGTVGDASYTFTASASDVLSGPNLPLTVKLGETTVEGDGSYAVTLTEGENVITIEAADDAGNVARKVVTVVLDKTGPVITTSCKDQTVNAPSFTFTASAADGVDGKTSVSVTVNGAAAIDNDGSFTVTLKEGDNTVVITSTDAMGNESESTFTVKYVKQAGGGEKKGCGCGGMTAGGAGGIGAAVCAVMLVGCALVLRRRKA